MIIKPVQKNGDLILHIEGFFDCTEIVDYDKFIENEIPKYDFNRLILDLSDLEFIDSMGMGRLIILKKKMNKEDKKMKIINVSDDINSIFKIAELSQFLLEE
jgi:anti-sigma B factor antagonist